MSTNSSDNPSDRTEHFNTGPNDGYELSPSLGSGLVGTGRESQNRPKRMMQPDYEKALKLVVHPDTLQEWRDAGEDYRLTPEDQIGIRFKMQTMYSPWREIEVDQMWRKRVQGKDVLVAHVIERAEDQAHKKRSWSYFIGKRKYTEFEQPWTGEKYGRAIPINSEDVYTILFSRQEVERILGANTVEGVETKFMVDVGYTTLPVYSKDDFVDMAFEQLHAKYSRVVPGKTAPPSGYTGDIDIASALMKQLQAQHEQQQLREQHPLQQPIPSIPTRAAESGLGSTLTGKQLAIIMSADYGLGERILHQVAEYNPARARDLAGEAKQYLESVNQPGPGGPGVPMFASNPLTGVPGDVPQHAITGPAMSGLGSGGGGGVLADEKLGPKESVGFIRTSYEEGKPQEKEVQHPDGKIEHIDLKGSTKLEQEVEQIMQDSIEEAKPKKKSRKNKEKQTEKEEKEEEEEKDDAQQQQPQQ